MEIEKLKSNLQVGDMLLVHSKGLLSKTIRSFMKKYNRKFYPEKPLDKYFNHMAIIVEMWGELYTADATAKGFVIAPLFSVYKPERFENGTVRVYRPVKEFSEIEKKAINKQAVQFSIRQTRYEFLNFLWWIVYIVTNKKIFLGGTKDKKLFCFEGTSRCVNAGRVMFPNPVLTATPDVQHNDLFKQLYL